MKLITSAAYVSHGLASEMGKLPPCMLPVQNRRLYEHQCQLLNGVSEGDTYLSLPMHFQLSEYDENYLQSHHITPVRVPEGLSLGQSVVYVLNCVGRYDEPLYLLHGDTLFLQLMAEKDIFSVAQADDYYDWASVDDKDVYSGYFTFSNQSLLIKKIVENGYNFIHGIEAYQKEQAMKAVQLEGWLDFGLSNSYYRSISKMTTPRSFNSIRVSKYGVRKSSKDLKKMQAEAHWFENVPNNMKHYVPALYDRGDDFYEIEYFFLPSLANLFVFGRNTVQTWKYIIEACVEYIDDEARIKPEESAKIASINDKLYGDKTIERLSLFSKQSGISVDKCWTINGHKTPSLLEIAKEMDAFISKSDERFASIMHGDTCFSNILYDFRSKTIKVIDPRGIDLEGNMSVYGDFRYDVAKLAHSVLGMYDFIVGNRYTLEKKSEYDLSFSFERNEVIEQVQAWFKQQTFSGYSLVELSTYPIMVHLFLSMIPLHSDCPKRQIAFLANALRLYYESNH